jgi:hypothetical protein
VGGFFDRAGLEGSMNPNGAILDRAIGLRARHNLRGT